MDSPKPWYQTGPYSLDNEGSVRFCIVGPDGRTPRTFSKHEAESACFWMNQAYNLGARRAPTPVEAGRLTEETYVGREHIDGILAEAGMKEQALIAAGEKHLADSRSMILLAREVRLLRRLLSTPVPTPEVEAAREAVLDWAKSIYEDFAEAEVEKMPRSVREVWHAYARLTALRPEAATKEEV